jgi:hypothetical protein
MSSGCDAFFHAWHSRDDNGIHRATCIPRVHLYTIDRCSLWTSSRINNSIGTCHGDGLRCFYNLRSLTPF